MKRNMIAAILPAALLTLSLAACSTGTGNTPAESPAAESTAAAGEEAGAVTEEGNAEDISAETSQDAEAAAEETDEQESAEADTEAAAMAATEAAASAEDEVIKNGEYTLTVPGAYKDLVIVEVPENDEKGILFEVSEKASVEADKAQGGTGEGAGWLFSIGTENEQDICDKLCGDMSGEIVFAIDEKGTYFVKYHPTDVRFVREEYENIEEDMEQWGELNEWASEMSESFVEDNEGLTLEKHSNTALDIYFARIAYKNDIQYTLSSTEYGVMEPGNVDPGPYVSRMIKGVTFSYADIAAAPDGEYVVLAIPEDNVRYDFFFAEEGQNYVREVKEIDGESYETIYEAEFADDTYTANEIMNEWYHALAGSGEQAAEDGQQ